MEPIDQDAINKFWFAGPVALSAQQSYLAQVPARSRFERLSAVMWPTLVDVATRKEMNSILIGERRRPLTRKLLIPDSKRGCLLGASVGGGW